MVDIIGMISFFLISLGMAQFAVSMFMGRRQSVESRRRDLLLAVFDELDDDLPGMRATGSFEVFFLIPCLNEELVIAKTVAGLMAASRSTVVVVDDASDDATAERAVAAGGARVLVRRRELPEARLGKGPALNAGFEVVVSEVRRRRLDPSQVIVCVMDADGRLSSGAVSVVRRLFGPSVVGGVQLPVRIRNRGRLLTDFQDYEFWGLSAMQQAARGSTGTVSLGGNGQFTRLSALLELGRPPWSESLTEDLDLAITLMVRGWALRTTLNAYVDQQAVESVGALIRQRTRWMQGHLLCSARIPELWRSTRMSNGAVLEATNYLTVPVLLILPWSIIFNIGIFYTAKYLMTPPPITIFGSAAVARVVLIGAWYFYSFLPHIIAAFVYYRRRQGEIGMVRALVLSHLLLLYNYVTFAATWLALSRIARGQRGWTKTRREVESDLGSVQIGPRISVRPDMYNCPPGLFFGGTVAVCFGGPISQLPRTGFSVALFVVVGAVLVASGLLLVRLSRRRAAFEKELASLYGPVPGGPPQHAHEEISRP